MEREHPKLRTAFNWYVPRVDNVSWLLLSVLMGTNNWPVGPSKAKKALLVCAGFDHVSVSESPGFIRTEDADEVHDHPPLYTVSKCTSAGFEAAWEGPAIATLPARTASDAIARTFRRFTGLGSCT